jgi:hypothetical protein
LEAINLVELRDGAIWLVERRSHFVVVAPSPEIQAHLNGRLGSVLEPAQRKA